MGFSLILSLAINAPIWLALYLYGPSIRDRFFAEPSAENKGTRATIAVLAFFPIWFFMLFAKWFIVNALGGFTEGPINFLPAMIAAFILYARTGPKAVQTDNPKVGKKTVSDREQSTKEKTKIVEVATDEPSIEINQKSLSTEIGEVESKQEPKVGVTRQDSDALPHHHGWLALAVVLGVLFLLALGDANSDGNTHDQAIAYEPMLPAGRHRSFCITNHTLREISFLIRYSSNEDATSYRLRPQYQIELWSTYTQVPELYFEFENYALDAPVTSMTRSCGGRYEFDYRNLPPPGYTHGVYDPVGFYASP